MQNINTMSISSYASNMLRGTCTHSVTLKKGEDLFTGIYNGLSYWGRVEDYDGNFVEDLGVSQYSDDDCTYSFSVEDFRIEGGYEIIYD